ncbi:hypothetical protein [Pseudolysinimonas sp.]|uniref:hypothetical protein n=1 Tax=Pseudolysinimonas sp. TaxID=2680009 RepID=UPI003F7E69FE
MPDPVRTPAAALPLRWGRHGDRVACGVALIVAGGVAVAGSSALWPWLPVLGVVAHVAGWAILPAAGWRRVTAAAVATPATLLLLAGPHWIGGLVVGCLAWLLARHRPAVAWVTALLPAAAAVAIGATAPASGGLLPALGIMLAALVAAAWIAAAVSSGRFGAPSGRIRRRGTSGNS